MAMYSSSCCKNWVCTEADMGKLCISVLGEQCLPLHCRVHGLLWNGKR